MFFCNVCFCFEQGNIDKIGQIVYDQYNPIVVYSVSGLAPVLLYGRSPEEIQGFFPYSLGGPQSGVGKR